MSNHNPRRLPAEIYARRRVAAIVIVLVVVGLLVWGMVSFANRGSTTDPGATAASTSVPTTSATSSPATTSETSEAPTSSSVKPSQSKEPNPNAKDSCELADLRITATSDRPNYVGDVQPKFFMTVENPTAADCVVNLDEDELRFEVYDLATNNRVWADIDCYPSVLTGEESFEAGSERSFQAVWSRLGSQPGQCNSRQPVPAGSYFLHGVIGNNASDAYPFNLS